MSEDSWRRVSHPDHRPVLWNEAIAAEFVRALQARGLTLSERHPYAVARTFIDASDAIVALSVTKHSDRADELIEELKLLITSYFANYLD